MTWLLTLLRSCYMERTLVLHGRRPSVCWPAHAAFPHL